MALPDVLSRAQFADLLGIGGVSWMLDRGEEYSGLQSGVIIAKEYRSALWRASVSLTPKPDAEAARIKALIESRDGALRTFHLYDRRSCFPIAYPPEGADLSAVTIGAVGSDNKSVGLSGLPEDFKVSAGDMLSFEYGSGPSVALHRICEDKVATALGNTSLFEVRPHVRPGASAGATVTLIRPYAEMLIVPGTLTERSGSDMRTTIISFDAIQVI